MDDYENIFSGSPIPEGSAPAEAPQEAPAAEETVAAEASPIIEEAPAAEAISADDVIPAEEAPAAESAPVTEEAPQQSAPEAPQYAAPQGSPYTAPQGNPYAAPQGGAYNPQGYPPRRGFYDPNTGRYIGPQTGYAPYGQGAHNPGVNPYSTQPNQYRAYAPAPAAPAAPEAGAQVTESTPDKKKGKAIFFGVIAIILVFAIIAGTVAVMKNRGSSSTGSDGSSAAVTNEDGSLEGGDAAIAVSPAKSGDALTTEEIAEKARESCVGVLVYASQSSSTAAGQGSGIVVNLENSNGWTYVLTCAHVINDVGTAVKVQTEDGTSYDAEIVGYDTRTDVGVLKVKGSKLTACEIGDSSALKVGSSVYAVGNPGGIEFFGSFTDGIVSAIDRPIDSEIGYTMKCIQHTAAINPGNSGGALVNVYGQVIGINSQKIAASDYEGMGFSIPINSAVEIAEDLINYGYVPNRAKLGITYYSVSASTQYSMIAQFNQLPSGTLIINSISSDSSLYNTKAKQYDMIIAVDGQELDTADVLLEKIDGGKVGDKMTLTLCRVNSNYTLEKFDIEITLVEDKGDSSEDSTTTTTAFNPFDDYGGFNFGY